MAQLDEYLINTCNEMYKTACTHCKADYVDEDSCFWYHSVWQYLRLLNCVSSPEWHKDFYKEAIEGYIKKNNKSKIKILISGCADNSMLHVIVDTLAEVMKERPGLSGDIVAVDLCETPLLVCEKWWEKAGKESALYMKVLQSFRFSKIPKDIFKYSDSAVDLIITDAFLTRFPKDMVQALLRHWGSLLSADGQVITTVRIHEDSEITLNERYRQITEFVKKVLDRYGQLQQQIQFDISASQLKYKAQVYAVKMTSYSLGNENEIKQILEQHFRIIGRNRQDTDGELSKTSYGHYVLEKKNDEIKQKR